MCSRLLPARAADPRVAAVMDERARRALSGAGAQQRRHQLINYRECWPAGC